MFSDPLTNDTEPSAGRLSRKDECVLFLRRWLANPLKVGAIMPSAPALARRMARETLVRDGEVVVELGPGNTLVNLMKQIAPDVSRAAVSDPDSLHAALALVGGGR